jgi:hypothetical protein
MSNKPPSLYWGSAYGRIAERIIMEIENSNTFEDLRTALDGCEIVIKIVILVALHLRKCEFRADVAHRGFYYVEEKEEPQTIKWPKNGFIWGGFNEDEEEQPKKGDYLTR